jgi:cyclopropane-fatty-acyl-phospholipid synthase
MGLVPDRVIRSGIRRLCKQRLEEIKAGDCEVAAGDKNRFVGDMKTAPVAPVPDIANEQHYEVPPSFFSKVLGGHHKYSACYWDESATNLDQAEARALEISCTRAGIEDGMDVLDLGCGWGSLSLWIAKNYPLCRVTSVSNSSSQREYIEAIARRRGLANIQVITCDMNDFDAPLQYDRIVSVEMFEHMRNYRLLFRRVSEWLRRDGKFFMHIFCHRSSPYAFVDNGPADWMSRHFFSGGIMPSADLPLRFQQHLGLEHQWVWDGRHYEKTANAWLKNLDRQNREVSELFAEVYGADKADQWVQRWRIFFMACAELFGFNHGQEWFVSHYLFSRQADGKN